MLHGIAVPSASRLWSGPHAEDNHHFSSSTERTCGSHGSGMISTIQTRKDGYSICMGASAGGKKKLI